MTLLKNNGLRHKVALKITVRKTNSQNFTRSILRAFHTHPRLDSLRNWSPDEVMILVERIVRKTTANMGNMRRQVLRLLERGDKQNYQEWLTRQQEAGQITQTQGEMELLSQPSDVHQAPACKSSETGIRKTDNTVEFVHAKQHKRGRQRAGMSCRGTSTTQTINEKVSTREGCGTHGQLTPEQSKASQHGTNVG